MSRISQADEALERYYKQQNIQYCDNAGIGKFKAWAEDNGFDTEGIQEEFDVEPEESTLVDVDPDFQGTPAQIISIIKRCWNDPNAYTNEVSPLQVTAEHWNIEEHDIKNALKLYEQQCKTIFDQGMKGDQAIIRLLAVGEKLQAPYLQFLADMYSRDRLAENSSLLPAEWGLKNKHILELKGLKSGGKAPHTDTISAIVSFFHRIVPKLMLNAQTHIEDSVEQAAKYITASVDFVSQLANQPQLSCPFQVDICIAFNKAKDCGILATQGLTADDDDSDDDDDDEHDDLKAYVKSDFYDCLGNIKHKLEQEKLLYTASTVNTIAEEKTSVRTARMFMDPFLKFKTAKISTKYKNNKAELEQYPRKHRFVSLIDRRKPEHGVDKGAVKEDEIIFFEPPDNCNTFPQDNDTGKHVPLWYFDSSRTCIVPNVGYDHGKHLKEVDKNIAISDSEQKELLEPVTSATPCKGAWIVMSFHVESDDEIRAYLYMNGQIARFLPQDIINILPKFFNPEFGTNKAFPESKAAKDMVDHITPKLKDVRFDAFYNEYKNT